MGEKQKNSFLKRLLYPTSFKRSLFFLTCDVIFFILSLYLSFFLRFDFNIPKTEFKILLKALPVFILIKVTFFYLFNNYKIIWQYVSLSDLWKLIKGITVSEVVLVLLIKVFPEILPNFSNLKSFPRSIFFIDTILTLFFCGSIRISKRFFKEVLLGHSQKQGKNTLIIGAGNIGEMILRDILRQGCKEFNPIGFLDDDPRKVGTYLHGVKVLGPIKDFKKYIEKYRVETVIIAITNINYQTLKEIYAQAKRAGVKEIKVIPPIYQFHQPSVSLKSLEDIKIEDLIGRQPVQVNTEVIKKFLKNKTVLITGAGGSIGSEIVLQVLSFEPKKVILFDTDETELHNMQHKLKDIYGDVEDKAVFVVGDVRDELRLKQIFSKYKPDIVFHAAAYKHVPMMELNPEEAVKVNIFGTYNIAKVSVEEGVEKFIMISTDKAVNPTSIMGATKRIAEYICSAFNTLGKTKFISVRFGNVLGSR
ncbi:MAG: polysaccharide biosynthesis protein, partial [Thermodesulfobacteria bacterium]|nr:polysaccharide biosynthesis protein [Thermodesulfobacteriota bacterium]